MPNTPAPRVSLRTDAPAPGELARVREARQARREQAALDRMLANDSPDPKTGRPAIVLYPGVAVRALEELVQGRSSRVVARQCGVSQAWLLTAWKNGRLEMMVQSLLGAPSDRNAGRPLINQH